MSYKRQSKKYIVEKAKEKFGLTEDILEAGYVLDDGSLLNFSGGDESERNLDHRKVIELYGKHIGSGYEDKYMPFFQIEANAIRISESEGNLSMQLNIGQNPTNAQWLKIVQLLREGGGDLYFDIYGKRGKRILDSGCVKAVYAVRSKFEKCQTEM
ncbi:MAG: hypothetical protein Q8O12_02930 [Candidatus Omnitrophota bacterium]|nr:hypothetical protein [Candidatus Omnitrophota bacterium]